MTLKRFEDWPARLAAHLERARRKPFAWGSNDCALFAGDVVLAMTGDDLAANFRGRYTDEAGARDALRRHSGAGLEAAVASIAGAWNLPRLASVQFAQRGDVVLVKDPRRGGPLLAVVVGVTCVAPTQTPAVRGQCLEAIPVADAAAAWRI